MEDPCDVETYKGVGVRLVSPISGKVSYIPSANSSNKPVVGMKFNSIEHAFKFYKDYALSNGFSIRKHTEYIGKKGVLRYFVCSKQGFKKRRAFDSLNAENNKGKQKHRKPSSRVGCDVHVKLRLVNGKCEIYYFKEEHNHFFVHKEVVMFLPATRRVDHVKESAIQALAATNLGPVRAFNILKSLMGGYAEVGATKADFKNYKRDLNKYIGEYDADMIVQLILNKKKHLPNFTCEYTVKEDGTLGGLFWVDDVSKTNYMMFGDVGFDATYRSNKYDMVFVPFTRIDNHNRNVTLGAAILGSETADAYRWLLRTYINTFDQFCVTQHISKKEWDIILSDFGLSNHSWLHEIYGLRKDWIPAYYQDEKLSGLMRTMSRCERENHFFNQFCNPTSTLVEFYGHFDVVHLNGVSNYEIKDFLQPCSEYFKVMIRIEDMTLSCSCNRFDQFGLICRHIFYVFRVSDIKEYPKKYVLRRWTRDAVPNSSLRFEFIPEGCDKNWYEVEAIVRDIKATNDYIINKLVTIKYELSGYCDYLKSYKSKANVVEMVAPPLSRKARFASTTGMEEKNEVKIRVPIKQRTKGRPKRMKSTREIAISQAVILAGKKLRKCGFAKNPVTLSVLVACIYRVLKEVKIVQQAKLKAVQQQ
ncbi:hypothetical protein QVD17_30451 [Tagetes erecta]|uniref:SWIM-type domain-containing protein n=1 Tax=Tagetes erecta TaxID=13708 RepID=A0AAD8K5C6_TARER|nr:hypothetical protein QVD17_30451 [Tagetes erecta]